MTAVASAGTGPALVVRPATVTTRGVLAGTFAFGAPTPNLVSRMRTGVTGRKRDGVPPVTPRGLGPCADGCASSPGLAMNFPARLPARSTDHRSPGSSVPAE